MSQQTLRSNRSAQAEDRHNNEKSSHQSAERSAPSGLWRGRHRKPSPHSKEDNDFTSPPLAVDQSHARFMAAERRIKRHWYPVVLFLIFLNVSLLISCFWIIYRADEYATNKSLYLGVACCVIFAPLVPAFVLLFSPWPHFWKQKRDSFSERDPSPRWKNVVNITAALASFLITICYLLFSAIPTYNRPTWASGVEFLTEVPVPAIAFVIQHTNLNGIPLPVNYTYSDGQLASSFTYTAFDVHNGVDAPGGVYREPIQIPGGNFTAIVANNSAVQPVLSSPLGSGIAVGLGLTFNSTIATNVTGYTPQLLMAVFDARMPISATLECGLIQPLAVAAFTDSTFLISMSQIADNHGITRPPAEAPASCLETYEHLISDPSHPFTFFDTYLTQSSPTVSNYTAACDVEVDPDAICRSSVTFAWGTQFVRKQTSIPGRSKQEIWIDCGAIVGAVQFFAWFAMVFLHG